jgi:hypothetical protein
MLEKNLQAKIVKKLRAAGCFVRKVSSEGTVGFPDLCIVRSGVVTLVEVKTPKGRLSPGQVRCHEELAQAGLTVEVWRTLECADSFLERTCKLVQ